MGFSLSSLGQGEVERKGGGGECSSRKMTPRGLSDWNLPRGQDPRFQGLWRMDGAMGAVVSGGRTEDQDPANLLPPVCSTCLFLCSSKKICEVATTHLTDVPDTSPPHGPQSPTPVT